MRVRRRKGGAKRPFCDTEVFGFGDARGDDLGEDQGRFEIPDAMGEDYVVVWWDIDREGGEEGDGVCGKVEGDSGTEERGSYVGLGLGECVR